MDAVDDLIARTEQRRINVSAALEPARRAQLGQFFTPAAAASLIATMPRLPDQGTLRILDPGAGVGSLTAALIARILQEKRQLSVQVVAVEIESHVSAALQVTLDDCIQAAASVGVDLSATVLTEDLIDLVTGFNRAVGPLSTPFDLVIMNPPYRKLTTRSRERQALAADGVDCPNLYCTFLAAGTLALKPRGQLVAITPRSFANGPYFDAFRQFLLSEVGVDRLHIFESRSTVFADSDVLQENVVVSATRSGKREHVTISVSRGHTDDASTRTVSYSDVVRPHDSHRFIRIPFDEAHSRTAADLESLPGRIADLGISVSTGKVVDFRAREYLRSMPDSDSSPLIYPGNLRGGRVQWPLQIRKPQALISCAETAKLMLPNERFVLVKRFSSKEERRRVVAVIYEPDDAPADEVGFENHLNVYHCDGRGLDEHLARGLCLWLNSTPLDVFFRTFSGHTQVNATDLRSLPYPSGEQLTRLSEALGRGTWPGQDKIDSLVTHHVFGQE